MSFTYHQPWAICLSDNLQFLILIGSNGWEARSIIFFDDVGFFFITLMTTFVLLVFGVSFVEVVGVGDSDIDEANCLSGESTGNAPLMTLELDAGKLA